MSDRFQVRREQLGDNEWTYALWDNSRTPARIVKLYRTKDEAEAAAAALHGIYEPICTKYEGGAA